MPRTHIIEVEKDLYLLRIDDNVIKFFEALWEIPEGITYNAYLWLANDSAILIDGWKEEFSTLLVDSLNQLLGAKKLSYIVVQHAEPDHTGSLKNLIASFPEAKIIAHPLAIKMLKDFYGINPNRLRAVRDGEKLEHGRARLEFIYTPWLHWPETLMSFERNYRILFSCDAFGAYSMPRAFFDDEINVEEYMHYVRKYFATVIGHYSQFVLKALEKLKALKIMPKYIMPGHGIIWRKNVDSIIAKYNEWAHGKGSNKILIVYSSIYGMTEKKITMLVDTILLKAREFSIDPRDLDIKFYEVSDRRNPAISDIIGDAIDSRIWILGVETYEAQIFPTMKYITELLTLKVAATKHIAIIASYGWGAAAAKKTAAMLKEKGHKILTIIETPGTRIEEKLVKEAAVKILEALSMRE